MSKNGLVHRDSKTTEIPCQKLYQAEKVRPNKQMFPTRIEIIIRHPTSKFPYKNRDHFGATPPLPPTFINTLWLYQLQSSSKNNCFIIDTMSDTSDIKLQFEELPCMHS